jgi:hydroxymethylglutaryl-CoA reductase
MNGIDSVCLATGQDWRAVESSAHAYAARGHQYLPMTYYQIFLKNGEQFFRGSLELPISVGTVGGVLGKNPIYKNTL